MPVPPLVPPCAGWCGLTESTTRNLYPKGLADPCQGVTQKVRRTPSMSHRDMYCNRLLNNELRAERSIVEGRRCLIGVPQCEEHEHLGVQVGSEVPPAAGHQEPIEGQVELAGNQS